MRYASKYSAILRKRAFHQANPSRDISSQLYVGNPQFCPIVEKASGGAPAWQSRLNRRGSFQASTLVRLMPMGMSPFSATPLEWA